ncbi:MAG: diacylglycerol kinase family protein [Lachnospiraceae bacterium]|nr:diacylglycerol kinase family protein [Lachnospiraceae bacterium]
MDYFILNPKAHSSQSTLLWPAIHQRLHQTATPYKVCATEYEGHATVLARDISENDPDATIVVVGGDGSVHEVINGLTHLDTVKLGVIPHGSGNDFVNGLHIPTDPEFALNAILSPRKMKRIDLGCLEADGKKSLFGVSCGIGMDASICEEALSSPIKDTLNEVHLGQMTYGTIGARQVVTYEPGPMKVRLDGERIFTYKDMFFLTVMNLKYEGGGLELVPWARPDDGILDIFVCGDGLTRAELVSAIPLARKGLHVRYPHIHFVKCKTVEVIADKKRPVHLDGESFGLHSKIRVTLLPRALNVITG